MKNIVVGLWLTAACVGGLVAGAGPSVLAAPSEPKTAREFFMNLPTDYLKVEGDARAKMISEKAVEPDHLYFTAPVEGMEGWGELKVFKKSDGTPVIAMVVNGCVDGQCMGQPLFLAYENGQYRDISEETAPSLDNAAIVAELRKAGADVPADAGEVPLTITFNEDLIFFLAGQKTAAKPGTPIRAYRWTGNGFAKAIPSE
jgi:hypothetical protein